MDTRVIFINKDQFRISLADVRIYWMCDDKPIVGVLMSTYNGEKYIREQLDSIFEQEDVDVKLFVRDDGSSDRTKNILREYAATHNLVDLSDGERVGPGESFMRLLCKAIERIEVQYLAFADQDDIWLKNKLSVAIKKIELCKEKDAVLYSSNQFLYVNGVNKGKRHADRQSVDLINHMTKNTIAGCTFVLNRDMATLITDAEKPDSRVIKYRLHDAWIMLIAIVCGHVIYDENAYMFYRIHEDNVVGIKTESLAKRLSKLARFVKKRDDANIRMITAQEMLRLYPHMNEKNKQIVRLFANYQNSMRDKFRLAFDKDIRKGCVENANVFSIKVLMNFV